MLDLGIGFEVCWWEENLCMRLIFMIIMFCKNILLYKWLKVDVVEFSIEGKEKNIKKVKYIRIYDGICFY